MINPKTIMNMKREAKIWLTRKRNLIICLRKIKTMVSIVMDEKVSLRTVLPMEKISRMST
jgi:hypothetical protein